MSVYPLDYSCNGPAIQNSEEQFYLNSILSCIFLALVLTPIFVKFHRVLLDKILETFQYFHHIQNIFKDYYHKYQQLQHLCPETSLNKQQAETRHLVQTDPQLQEYIK